jgi:hypothetical protein
MLKTKLENIGTVLFIGVLALGMILAVITLSSIEPAVADPVPASKALFLSQLDSLCSDKETQLRTQLNESEDIVSIAQQIEALGKPGGCEQLGINILEDRLKAKGEV